MPRRRIFTPHCRDTIPLSGFISSRIRHPLPAGTSLTGNALFDQFDGEKMAGIWSKDKAYPESDYKLILPSGLTEINEFSFEAIAPVEEVFIPDGAVVIGKRAFAGSSVRLIHFPDSVTSISEDAFLNTPNLHFYCSSENSAAAAYARSHDIPYKIREQGRRSGKTGCCSAAEL